MGLDRRRNTGTSLSGGTLAGIVKDRHQQMKQIQLIFLLIMLFQISCKTDKKQVEKEIDDLKPFPVVLDTLGIDTFMYSYVDENPFKKYYIEWYEEMNYKGWTQCKIEIQMDTTNKISNLFPVILTNIDTDTTFIGYGSHIPNHYCRMVQPF